MTRRVVMLRGPVIGWAAVSLAALTCPAGAVPGARVAGAGHGGVVELSRAAAGPYLLSVWTQPSPPTAGPWRIDIVVMGESGVPVIGAAVRVRAEPLEHDAAAVEA